MIKVFFDSSVLIASMLSETGGSAKILMYLEAKFFEGYISKPVVNEVNAVIARKMPEMASIFQNLLKFSKLKIVEKVEPKLLKEAEKWISDKNDAPILAAAKQISADIVLTLDLRHFIYDKDVAKKCGMKILTPGEFLKGFVKFCK